MIASRRSIGWTRGQAIAAAAVLLAACRGGEPKAPAHDTASTSSATPAGAVAASPAAASGWQVRAMGPVLLVAGTSPDQAIVVTPDSTRTGAEVVSEKDAIAIRSTPATLLGRSDSVQIGILQAQAPRARAAASSDCIGWPTWQVTAPATAGGKALSPWAIGFVGVTVETIPVDSVESMSRADSAKLAAEVTRLASSIPAAPNSGEERLAGLPFTVRSLWRFQAAPGVEAVAATLERRVNQEARPFEERTLLVAERDSTRKSDLFDMAYSERSRGDEDTIESGEVLGGVRFGATGPPVLVIARDYGDGTAYALLEREPSGKWRARWTSGRGKC